MSILSPLFNILSSPLSLPNLSSLFTGIFSKKNLPVMTQELPLINETRKNSSLLTSFREKSLEQLHRGVKNSQIATVNTAKSVKRQILRAKNRFSSEMINGFFEVFDVLFSPFFFCEIIFWISVSYLRLSWWIIEITIFSHFYLHNHIPNYEDFRRLFLRYVVFRIFTLYCYTHDVFEFPFEMEILVLPVGISWYIFEPQFIFNGQKYNERFDYFLQRYPYFTGFGLGVSLCAYLDQIVLTHFFVILMLNSSICSREISRRPKYATRIPYSPETFTFDPVEIIESTLISSK